MIRLARVAACLAVILCMVALTGQPETSHAPGPESEPQRVAAVSVTNTAGAGQGFGGRPAVPDDPRASSGRDYEPGRVIVRVRDGISVDAANRSLGVATLDATARAAGVHAIRSLSDTPGVDAARRASTGFDLVYVLDFSEPVDPRLLAEEFASHPDVEYAEPDFYHYLHGAPASEPVIPDDPLFHLQWGLSNTGQAIPHTDDGSTPDPVGTPGVDINAQQAWSLTTGSSDVAVAILDSGVDIDHPEFAGRVRAGWDFIDNDDDPRPTGNAHGTAAAGIALAAGNNGQGIAGVAWQAELIPVRVCAGNSCTTSAIASGIAWASDQGASILSLSLGGTSLAQAIADAVDYAYTAGVAIFASTGNRNSTGPNYPAALPDVISVGALSPCNERKSPTSCDGEDWWGSSYGRGMDFLAPGTRIHTTDIQGDDGYTDGDYTATFNGTSAACPFAAGVGALVLSVNPDLSPAELRAVMQRTAIDMGPTGYDDETGFGRIDAHAAVRWNSLTPIADARASGAGASVQVEGIVTRALGHLVFFQDESGGLLLEQPPGSPVFEDVGSGAIETGTVIRVSGELSEVDGILRIGPGALSDHEVVGTTTPVTPTEVTLAQLADPSLESTLLRVYDAAIVDGGGVFESDVAYLVTDPSIVPATIQLQVPGDQSNTIAGSPIPAGAFTFTGVAGAPHGLMAILESDVRAVELAFAPTLEQGIEVDLPSGTTASESLTLTNLSDGDLHFRFSQFSGTGNARAYPANPLGHLPTERFETVTKGAEADHPTHLPARGEGGPDAFGYHWIDSEELGGPTFEPIDISQSGFEYPLESVSECGSSAADEGAAAIELPFAFYAYGGMHDTLWVSANGFVALQPIEGCSFNTRPIPAPTAPTAASPGAMLAPLWVDLHAYDSGRVLAEQLDDGRFVIQWDRFRRYGQQSSSDVTFQLILDEGGAIRYQYLTIEGSFGPTTRIGLQDHAGEDGLLIASGSGYAVAGKAVLISNQPRFVADVTPSSGMIAPGESLQAMISFDAAGFAPGPHSGYLLIETSETVPPDRASPAFTTGHRYPVTAHVGDSSIPQVLVGPTELHLVLGPDETASATVLVRNRAPEGADDLTLAASVHDAGGVQLRAQARQAEESAPVSVTPVTATVPAGETIELTVLVDGGLLTEPSSEYTLVIETNDPASPSVEVGIAVELTTVDAEGGALPEVLALEQNYPNPFAGSTTIEFALPETGAVRLEVFDVTGRHVATLFDAVAEAGRHAAVWDSRHAAAGTYVIRLTAGREVLTLRATRIP